MGLVQNKTYVVLHADWLGLDQSYPIMTKW
jgi:hypothetical protein